MSPIIKGDWLTGPVLDRAYARHIALARKVLSGQSSAYAVDLWTRVKSALLEWIDHNAPYSVADMGLEAACRPLVFKVSNFWIPYKL